MELIQYIESNHNLSDLTKLYFQIFSMQFRTSDTEKEDKLMLLKFWKYIYICM